MAFLEWCRSNLWSKLNSFWVLVVRDFTLFRYRAMFQDKLEEDIDKDDAIVYDADS